MLRWTDLETRTPEEVLAAGRAKNRQAISEAVNIALLEKKQEQRAKLEEDFKAWLKDAETCLNNGIRIFLIKQALLKNQIDLAKKHLKYIEPRDDIERAELMHVLQDYNDKVIEAQTRRLEKHRKRERPQLTPSQDMMLREIVLSTMHNRKYTSLVNHGVARNAVEVLEQKGFVQIQYANGKTINADLKNKTKAKPLIENVLATQTAYEYVQTHEQSYIEVK